MARVFCWGIDDDGSDSVKEIKQECLRDYAQLVSWLSLPGISVSVQTFLDNCPSGPSL